MAEIICLDLLPSGHKNSIASFVIPYSGGAIVIDPGPGSTKENLQAGLAENGLSVNQVTHVLLTHIHLDHAGAAGWLAGQGADILVHPAGASHMLNPEKLLASAKRIYGEKMDDLWGEILPVPSQRLFEIQDGLEIKIGELIIRAIHTPGHAKHHIAYQFQDTCFTGDVGGVRKPGLLYVMLPFVPPETDFESWRESLNKIRQLQCKNLAVTHFGVFSDAKAHLSFASQTLDEVEEWMEANMAEIADVETLKHAYENWLHQRGLSLGISEDILHSYDYSSPIEMAASGLFRYWHKVRPMKKE